LTDTLTLSSVAILGCGYVGYPLSLLAAEAGYEVLAVDIDERIVETVNAGEPLLEEPGVATLVELAARSGRLSAAATPRQSDVFIVAVPTPVDDGGRQADLSAVVAATRSIVPYLQPGNLVIVESTIPPGTCTNLVAPILEESGLGVGDDFLLAHCPERVHPGATMEELVHIDRIIGGVNEESTRAAKGFYSSFVKGKLVETDAVTAELCKVMENTYRDVNIALANQIAEIAEEHGVDAIEAVRIANGHPRVNYLVPGIGVGGHCIPVDPWFLLSNSVEGEGVIGAARRVNDRQPQRIADMIVNEVRDIESPRIVLIGAAYKTEVTDLRNSPALQVRDELLARGFGVETYDPLTTEYSGDLLEMASGADLLAVLVPHRRVVGELRANADRIGEAMRRPRILDFSTGAPRPF